MTSSRHVTERRFSKCPKCHDLPRYRGLTRTKNQFWICVFFGCSDMFCLRGSYLMCLVLVSLAVSVQFASSVTVCRAPMSLPCVQLFLPPSRVRSLCPRCFSSACRVQFGSARLGSLRSAFFSPAVSLRLSLIHI